MNPKRGILIAGNWKMHLGPKETAVFVADLGKRRQNAISGQTRAGLQSGKLRAMIIPPALSLPAARASVDTAWPELQIAAQNAHGEKKGAFTGELSGPMLADIGIRHVLLGHSERRQLFGETDTTVRSRLEGLLDQGFEVILCIGETLAERESGDTQAVLLRQLAGALPDSGPSGRFLDGRIVIAYEPVWAIGTGKTATPAQAQEAHAVIRADLQARFGTQAAERTLILYGGSVKPENIKEILTQPDVDGALVGGASLDAASYLALVEAGGQALGHSL